MKKFKKVAVLIVIILFSFCNICFADIVFTNEVPQYHGNYEKMPNNYVPTIEPITYIITGAFVLIIVVCAAIIIRRIIKKKKDKKDDNK